MKATITFEDTINGKVEVKVVFKPALDMKTEGKKLSNAQFMALDCIEMMGKHK